jgi:hypothetical protein
MRTQLDVIGITAALRRCFTEDEISYDAGTDAIMVNGQRIELQRCCMGRESGIALIVALS